MLTGRANVTGGSGAGGMAGASGANGGGGAAGAAGNTTGGAGGGGVGGATTACVTSSKELCDDFESGALDPQKCKPNRPARRRSPSTVSVGDVQAGTGMIGGAKQYPAAATKTAAPGAG